MMSDDDNGKEADELAYVLAAIPADGIQSTQVNGISQSDLDVILKDFEISQERGRNIEAFLDYSTWDCKKTDKGLVKAWIWQAKAVGVDLWKLDPVAKRSNTVINENGALGRYLNRVGQKIPKFINIEDKTEGKTVLQLLNLHGFKRLKI